MEPNRYQWGTGDFAALSFSLDMTHYPSINRRRLRSAIIAAAARDLSQY
jgi:hypothetical protein